ncbi:MAG TPA: hypothetical protein PLE24_15555 [Chitinispirillaceae bacterium]|nr:hypothetical protein [Chitinispirillaceae bacterium]
MPQKSSSTLFLVLFLAILSFSGLNSPANIRDRISCMAVLLITTVNLHWIYSGLLSRSSR